MSEIEAHSDGRRLVGLQLRLREKLRKQIEIAASHGGRSMNAEVLARLEASFAAEAHNDLMARVSRLEKAVFYDLSTKPVISPVTLPLGGSLATPPDPRLTVSGCQETI